MKVAEKLPKSSQVFITIFIFLFFYECLCVIEQTYHVKMIWTFPYPENTHQMHFRMFLTYDTVNVLCSDTNLIVHKTFIIIISTHAHKIHKISSRDRKPPPLSLSLVFSQRVRIRTQTGSQFVIKTVFEIIMLRNPCN